MYGDMGQIGVGKSAHRKIDGRSAEAKRLKAWLTGITEPEVQSVALRRLAASLAMEGERLEAAQACGEQIDPDALVRLANALTRTLTQLNELVPDKKHWISAAEKAEREERMQYLHSLSEVELLALREQVAPGTAPATVPAPEYVEPVLTDAQRGVYRESEEARAYALTQKKNKIERTPEDIEADEYRNCGVEL